MKVFTEEIKVDYSRAKLPVGETPADFNPKKDDSIPRLTAYLHDDKNDYTECPFRLRKAVLVLPGGGYGKLSQREAEPIAMEYFASGYQTFILWYSIKPNVFPAAFMEEMAAVKYIRDHAEEFGIFPDKIATIGFSAGGHLAACLSTLWQEPWASEMIGATPEDIHPNASILGYPVITAEFEKTHKGTFKNLLLGLPEELWDYLSLEKRVSPDTPPTFLWSTWNDQLVPIQSSTRYANALADQGVSCEVHIFRNGVHGLALANEVTEKWPDHLTDKGEPSKQINPFVEPWMDLSKKWLSTL